MKSIESSGKTVEEAVGKALEELGIKEDNADIKIITKPTQGFLGLIGSKMAKVRVTETRTPIDFTKEYISNILEKINLDGNIDIDCKDGQTIEVNISGNNMGILIGKRGQTLQSLQYLANIALHKQFDFKGRILIDVEGYRDKREQSLIHLANNLALKVQKIKRDVVLEPMTPQERRIIHTTLQKKPYIKTHSKGDEPLRKVVISYKAN